MKTKILLFIFLPTLILNSCNSEPKITPEPWISKPVSQWPDMALTNEIAFTDTTFTNLANAFLISTGTDTFAVTCKHIFMVFESQLNYKNISLGKDFISWSMYPENNPDKRITTETLINQDPKEEIGGFNTLKERDWLVFKIKNAPKDIHVFKIKDSNPRSGETIFSIGWGNEQINQSYPSLVKMEFIRGAGYHYYTKILTQNVKGVSRSGSAVIDQNGYLVGIVSGAEGNLSVMGSTAFLKTILP